MSSFNHIAILGRQPELGLVELESLLGAERVQPFGRLAALIADEVSVDRLGGAQKIGRVLYDGPVVDLRPLPIDMAALLTGDGKTPFAISVYGLKATRRFVEAAGLALKKELRQRGASVRLIAPSDGLAVTAAQLRHNGVLERGFELLVVVSGQRMIVARTTGVQDIDWYSRRDYGRPARSAVVGMLPPKLAQILVN
ncbi:MAG: putative methylase, partial [Patescibacteria group bacterium]|nr:putative methylase [Patescibacteria group bacterium]